MPAKTVEQWDAVLRGLSAHNAAYVILSVLNEPRPTGRPDAARRDMDADNIANALLSWYRSCERCGTSIRAQGGHLCGDCRNI